MHEQEYPWAAIRHAYLHGDCTVNQICARFKLSRTRFYKEARSQNWPTRTSRSIKHDADFVDQMMGVLARQLIQLDGRISTDKSVDAVALGNIAKTYEKIQELTKADQVDEEQQRV